MFDTIRDWAAGLIETIKARLSGDVLTRDRLIIVAALLLAFGAGAVLAQPSLLQVVGQRCDKNGAVSGLQLAVAQAGVHTITWDNAQVCGRPI